MYAAPLTFDKILLSGVAELATRSRTTTTTPAANSANVLMAAIVTTTGALVVRWSPARCLGGAARPPGTGDLLDVLERRDDEVVG
jgi:hypothetical protein